MPLIEHSLTIEVIYADGKRAPFTRLRIDTEYKNATGQTLLCSLAQLIDEAPKPPPYLLQYTLKDPNAILWLVLVVGDREERQRVRQSQHRYVFGDLERKADHPQLISPPIIHILNHFYKEINMPSSYTISAGSIGAVGDNAHAENFTQNVTLHTGISAQELAALVTELPRLTKALMEKASTSEQFEAVAHVKAAEEAAVKNDAAGLMDRLKRAGSWALEVARGAGTEVAAKVIAHLIMAG